MTAPSGKSTAQSATSDCVGDSADEVVSCTATPRSRSVRTKIACCSSARAAIGDGSPLIGGSWSIAADGRTTMRGDERPGVARGERAGIGFHGHDLQRFAGRCRRLLTREHRWCMNNHRVAVICAVVPALALTLGVGSGQPPRAAHPGLPFVLAWIVAWVLLTPAFMWVAYRSERA